MAIETSHARGNGKDEIAHKLRETKAAFSDAAHKAKDTAGTVSDQMLQELKVQTEELRKKSSDYIRKKPLVAIGGAALAGFVLALLLRR